MPKASVLLLFPLQIVSAFSFAMGEGRASRFRAETPPSESGKVICSDNGVPNLDGPCGGIFECMSGAVSKSPFRLTHKINIGSSVDRSFLFYPTDGSETTGPGLVYPKNDQRTISGLYLSPNLHVANDDSVVFLKGIDVDYGNIWGDFD